MDKNQSDRLRAMASSLPPRRCPFCPMMLHVGDVRGHVAAQHPEHLAGMESYTDRISDALGVVERYGVDPVEFLQALLDDAKNRALRSKAQGN